MIQELSAGDRDLLAQLRDRFPLVAMPYAVLAERLQWREEEVLSRLWRCRARGDLCRIGADFDPQPLGYAGAMVALAVQPARLDRVAEEISRHPRVSHSCRQEHTYNLWFTLTTPPGRDLQGEARRLAAQPGVRQQMVLPVVRSFWAGMRHTVEGLSAAAMLSPQDVPLVRALQEDLPLSSRPFRVLARRFEVSEGAVLAAAGRMLSGGVMRRYGATLGYPRGSLVSGMVCWQVPAEEVMEAGEAAAGHPAVSSCCEWAARSPDWPYQLCTTVHGSSQEELARALAELQSCIRPQRLAFLPTLTEYKRTCPRYFED